MTKISKFVEKIRKGDLLCSRWGSEHAKVSFYLVVKRTPKFVWLQPVASEDFSQSQVWPVPGYRERENREHDPFRWGEIFRKKIGTNCLGDAEIVRTDDGWAQIWDGKPVTGTHAF